MSQHSWVERFAGAITVCDPQGTIIEMNEQSARVFAAGGGRDLVGCDVFACHSQASVEKLREMMAEQRANVYTIEKKGQKKLIFQTPWYEADGSFGGFVELSLPIPQEMPHFVRD
ncbi:MAG TPA: PAS domain-containing protein [Anaerolineaceae bacterium]